MLVLSRKIGESIIIGGEIELTVLGTDRGQIKIGFDAPDDVTINRLEVEEKQKREGKKHPKFSELISRAFYRHPA